MVLQAILFDCDGVLVDSEIVGLEDSVEFLKAHGFSLTVPDVIRRFTGMRSDLLAKEMRAEYAEILGRSPSDQEFHELFEGFVDQRRAKRHTMAVVPGAIEMLQSIATRREIKLAVASSSAQIFLDSKVDRFGFRPFFGDHVYSADFVDHGKPAPDIFLHAAMAIDVEPADCLVIEDSPNGVAAGVAAGSIVWGFTGGGHCLDDHADRLLAEGAKCVVSTHKQLSVELRKALATPEKLG